MARVIKICKIFRNSVARVTSKRWLAEWLALSKYVKSLEIRWLALQVSVGMRWLAEWLALSKYVKSLETRLWPVLRRDNFSVYVICASRIIFNNLYEIYHWYLDNASHSESQSLLITRATALY